MKTLLGEGSPAVAMGSDTRMKERTKKARTPAALAWVVSADMGYGHKRAVHPLREIAEGGIISVGENDAASPMERKLWHRLLRMYESFSRAWSIPVVGRYIFGILDAFLRIPTLYPLRNLSHTTFQVELLESFIRKGLCEGMLERIKGKNLPLVTSFYAPAIAADKHGTEKVYCIICDADLNRVWVARSPGRAASNTSPPAAGWCSGSKPTAFRTTGSSSPASRFRWSWWADRTCRSLKADLGQRLSYLDPRKTFWHRHGVNVEHLLGAGNCTFRGDRELTITYSVGGAGAMKEIGAKIAWSLKDRIHAGEVRLNLAAGTKEIVRRYYEQVKAEIAGPPDGDPGDRGGHSRRSISLQFNAALRTTDILWTKPSELSFYAGLGLPIITTAPLGSQETFNARWLRDIQAGIRQENPEYTHQWLFDLLKKGRLAEAAWSGFLKARKLGTYKIIEVLRTGTMKREHSPIMR